MAILCVGESTLEHFAVVDRFPDPGMSVEMSKFSVQGGGSAANAAVLLAKWGVDTKFCGAVGDDERADQIERGLAGAGVDTGSLIRRESGVSQFSFVELEFGTGRSKNLFTRGSVPALPADVADDVGLEDVDLLLVDGAEVALHERLVERAGQRGVPVLIHARDRTPSNAAWVAGADYLVVSERFASRFTGVGELDRMCEEILELGVEAVALTLGNEGIVGATRDRPELVRLPAFEVEVVDTTGAGDVFAGAFAYGVLQDWSFEDTVRYANVAGALTCSGIGARGALPSLERVKQEM